MKKVVSFVSMAAIIVVFLGIMASAATYPNAGGLNINGSTAEAYVQIQASHVEAGNLHAMQGRVRVILQDADANISYTGYSYTAYASGFNDTLIHSATRTATIPSGGTAMEQHHFYWVSGGYWGNAYGGTE